MNHLKLFEEFNQNQIDTIEDLFTMYFVDGWGAKDTLKIPKETGQDYQDYLQIPLSYRLSFDGSLFRISLFISPNSIDMDKLLEDIKAFIERVRKTIGSETFSCKAGFQEGGSFKTKKVYSIRMIIY